MRTKNVTSIALLFMLMLLGQAMTGHLYQYPGIDVDSSLESESIVMASNSTAVSYTHLTLPTKRIV